MYYVIFWLPRRTLIYAHISDRLAPFKHWPTQLQYSFDHMNFDIYKTMWGNSEFNVTGNLKNFDRFDDLNRLNMPVLS